MLAVEWQMPRRTALKLPSMPKLVNLRVLKCQTARVYCRDWDSDGFLPQPGSRRDYSLYR